MMLRSMTGFGAAASPDGSLRVEMRSVNHRHLQAKLRVPHELAALEPEIDKRLKKRLERGSINLSIHRSRTASDGGPTIDRDVARRVHEELADVARELGLAPPTLELVLGVPGVVAHHDDPVEGKGVKAVIALVEEALGQLIAMREAEGGALQRDLALHAERLEKVSARIEKRAPKLVREHQRLLHARIKELLGGKSGSAPDDLGREVALLADKLDVSEEIARLASHQAQLAKLLEQGGAIGRKLEFLIQEILREVNTIGSKANDAQVAQWVVEAKTHVERLREQAANVE